MILLPHRLDMPLCSRKISASSRDAKLLNSAPLKPLTAVSHSVSPAVEDASGSAPALGHTAALQHSALDFFALPVPAPSGRAGGARARGATRAMPVATVVPSAR